MQFASSAAARRGIVGAVLAVACSVAGLAATAAPAAAAPYWQSYTIASNWSCSTEARVGAGQIVSGAQQMYLRSCVVVSGVYAQAVLIMTNRSDFSQRLEGPDRQYARLVIASTGAIVPDSTSSCLESYIAGGQSAACFARTVTVSRCTSVYADVQGGVLTSAGSFDFVERVRRSSTSLPTSC